VLEEVKNSLPAELLNRLNALIVFRPLTKLLMSKIFSMQVEDFLVHRKRKYNAITFPSFTPKKIEKIIDEIYDPAY
jgi:ATP-dependent Clp protease ATP-binding subunit ClpA